MIFVNIWLTEREPFYENELKFERITENWDEETITNKKFTFTQMRWITAFRNTINVSPLISCIWLCLEASPINMKFREIKMLYPYVGLLEPCVRITTKNEICFCCNLINYFWINEIYLTIYGGQLEYQYYKKSQTPLVKNKYKQNNKF